MVADVDVDVGVDVGVDVDVDVVADVVGDDPLRPAPTRYTKRWLPFTPSLSASGAKR